jgi:hypothetical protein
MEDFAERINRYIAEREKFDPVAVYEQMKDVYAVVVTMEPAYDYEIPVLRGESSAGKFEVWDNGLDIIFDIYKPDGTYTHWHPSDVSEATEAVREFMNGICER